MDVLTPEQARAMGRERGWDHANFVEAYGKEHERRGPDYPSQLGLNPNEEGITYRERHSRIWERNERVAARQAFSEGWTEGRRFFHQGKYHDGTAIED